MAPLFGYHMPSFSFPGVPPAGLFPHLVELTQAADEAGFDFVTVMDHFYQIPNNGSEDAPMMEAYTTLAALAMRTSRVLLGTLVTGVTYRNPALLAKMVTTLDVVSGGRALLGIGAAWNESEHRGYGYEFPPVRERMERLDEALQIARLMFTSSDRASFSGKYYRIEGALNVPRPLQPGGPRILVGGGGEKRTLRLAAEHADMTHWFVGSLEEFKHKMQVLDEHCRAVGRDPSSIVRTIGAPVTVQSDDSPAALADALRPYMNAGAQGFVFRNPNLTTPALLHTAGKIKAHLT